jgi:hypothetical protein
MIKTVTLLQRYIRLLVHTVDGRKTLRQQYAFHVIQGQPFY